MEYPNQSLKPEVFGCPVCSRLKNITEAVDVDFAQQTPRWNPKTTICERYCKNS